MNRSNKNKYVRSWKGEKKGGKRKGEGELNSPLGSLGGGSFPWGTVDTPYYVDRYSTKKRGPGSYSVLSHVFFIRDGVKSG